MELENSLLLSGLNTVLKEGMILFDKHSGEHIFWKIDQSGRICCDKYWTDDGGYLGEGYFCHSFNPEELFFENPNKINK